MEQVSEGLFMLGKVLKAVKIDTHTQKKSKTTTGKKNFLNIKLKSTNIVSSTGQLLLSLILME